MTSYYRPLFQVFRLRCPQTHRADYALPQVGKQLQHSALLHHDPRLDRVAHNSGRYLRHHVLEETKLIS